MGIYAPSRRLKEIRSLLNSIEVRTNAIMHVIEEYDNNLGKPQDVHEFLKWARVLLGDILAITHGIRQKFGDGKE